MTPGQKLVRRDPRIAPGDTMIEHFKEKTAVIIDSIMKIEGHSPRLALLAQEAYEKALLLAIKLAETPGYEERPHV